MRINKEQVQENMKDSECVLINVLSKSEYKKMHIKGSESFPLTDDHSAFTKEVGDKFGKKKNLIVYGERFGILDGFEAAKALTKDGFKVENYSGGLQEWFRAGLPVEGTEVNTSQV
jgi:rhodanese-related sulfurtransferase